MVDEGASDDTKTSADQSPRGAGEDLCVPFVDLLPVTGVSISVIGGPGRQSTIGASDAVAARTEELQFELGEGPHWEALRTGRPVLVSDVREEGHADWPMFGAAVLEIGVGALFAFPLVMGAVTIGVVDMYRSSPGALGAGAIAQALALAGSAAGPALRLAARSAVEENPADAEIVPEMRREVHQATGMILVQLEITATEAFFRLRAHAYSSGQTVQYVAHEVVMRRLDFRGLTE